MSANLLDFGHGTFTLGGGEMICQIQNATLVPANTRQDIDTACGTTTRFVNPRFDLRIRFAQDWHTGGISQYLWANAGTDKAFVFSPSTDSTPKMAGTITCPYPSFGGDALGVLTDEVLAPIVGIPTLTVDA